ncbi:hypothetical protein DL95DRAFT_388237 [Leptodontidium sp. 2 PMI_412]|nr:hypothetical protein DL95DRAFT_388237 [Leptodontidium sp. 2 PMI_412]
MNIATMDRVEVSAKMSSGGRRKQLEDAVTFVPRVIDVNDSTEVVEEFKLYRKSQAQRDFDKAAKERERDFMIEERRRAHASLLSWLKESKPSENKYKGSSTSERKNAFMLSQKRKRSEFNSSFLRNLKTMPISDVRKYTIPAYTFTRFPDLPMEIQLRIWSMASRSQEPATHSLIGMDWEEEYNGCRVNRRGSSRLQHANWTSPSIEALWPVILRTCRNSRYVGLSVFARFNFEHMGFFPYVPVAYDSFYIGCSPWTEFKLLVDLLIKENTTREMDSAVKTDLAMLCKMRHIVVDFNVFAGVPSTVWTHFPDLESLTVSFYPSVHIVDTNKDKHGPATRPTFVTPKPDTKFGRRAEWITTAVNTRLQTAKDTVHNWTLPKIQVVLRGSEDDEVSRGDRHPGESGDEDDGSTDDESENGELQAKKEAIFYSEASERLSRIVSKADISRLKRRYHRRRVVKFHADDETGRRQFGQYFTDSENESSSPRYPYVDELYDLPDDEDWQLWGEGKIWRVI